MNLYKVDLMRKRLNSPQIGHQKRNNSSYKILKEVSSSSVDSVEVGQSFDCSIFEVGEKVSIQGISKEKVSQVQSKDIILKCGPKHMVNLTGIEHQDR